MGERIFRRPQQINEGIGGPTQEARFIVGSPETPCYTYFAATKDRKFVKIGCSNHPGSRITSLRAWMIDYFGHRDVEFIGILPEYFVTEWEAQRLFKHLNVVPPPELATRRQPPVEWFTYSDEILRYLESTRAHQVPRVHWYCRARVFWKDDPQRTQLAIR